MKKRIIKPLLLCAAVLFTALALNVLITATGCSQMPTGSKFGHLTVSGDQTGFVVFDPKTGDVWCYTFMSDGSSRPAYAGRLVEPGQPLDRK